MVYGWLSEKACLFHSCRASLIWESPVASFWLIYPLLPLSADSTTIDSTQFGYGSWPWVFLCSPLSSLVCRPRSFPFASADPGPSTEGWEVHDDCYCCCRSPCDGDPPSAVSLSNRSDRVWEGPDFQRIPCYGLWRSLGTANSFSTRETRPLDRRRPASRICVN